jgi:SAM-dependent methyltransferase
MLLENHYDTLVARTAEGNYQWMQDPLLHYKPRYLKVCELIEQNLTGQRKTIVDLGCGFGVFLYLAVKMGFEKPIGVDYFVQLEETFIAEQNNAKILSANFDEYNFLAELESNTVDCVVCSQVFEHLFNYPLGFLKEAWRIVRPNGLLIIDIPNPNTFASAVRLIRGQSLSWGIVDFAKTPKINEEGKSVAKWDIHYMDYSQKDLEEIVSDLPGVQIIEKGFVGTGISPSDSWLRKMLKSLLWITNANNSRLFGNVQYIVLAKRSS